MSFEPKEEICQEWRDYLETLTHPYQKVMRYTPLTLDELSNGRQPSEHVVGVTMHIRAGWFLPLSDEKVWQDRWLG